MNSSNTRGDLFEYFAIVWSGRRLIALGTVASVILMALLTWALPQMYVIRSVIDTGALSDVRPRELNLLVEAVDRNQFVVEGGHFSDSLTDSLSASFRPPQTMILEARSADPADATRRLAVVTGAVHTEIQTRFSQVRSLRTQPEERALALHAQANRQAKQLAGLFRERMTAAGVIAAAARDAAARAAAQRAGYQTQEEARLRPRLEEARARANRSAAAAIGGAAKWLAAERNVRAPDSIAGVREREHARRAVLARLTAATGSAFTDLLAVFQQITAYDLQVASAGEAERSARQLRERDAEAVELLTAAPAVADAAGAMRIKTALDEMERTYKGAGDTAAAEVQETAALFLKLADAYREADAALEGPLLTRVPHIVTPPVMPAEPAWPRPLVNLAIAALFGFVASVIVVVFSRPRVPARTVAA